MNRNNDTTVANVTPPEQLEHPHFVVVELMAKKERRLRCVEAAITMLNDRRIGASADANTVNSYADDLYQYVENG